MRNPIIYYIEYAKTVVFMGENEQGQKTRLEVPKTRKLLHQMKQIKNKYFLKNLLTY